MSVSSLFRKTVRTVAACFCVLFIAGAALAEGVAVRVNGREFSTATVQQYLNEYAANMPIVMGSTAQSLFGEDPEEFFRVSAEHFVSVAIVEDKLHAQGLDALTDGEEDNLRAYARSTYETLWQTIADRLKEEFPDETQTERQITQTLEQAGYSMDGIYEKALQSLYTERILSVYRPDLTVEDAEVEDFYRQSLLLPDREKYEGNVPLFESEILFGGGTSTYVPEGYFYIKYILLDLPEDRARALSGAQYALSEATAAVTRATEAVTQAVLDEQDPAAAREALLAAQEAEASARQAVDEQTRLAEADWAPMMDLVRTAMNDGESFESLIGKHSVQPAYTDPAEPGFPFHPDSLIWESSLREKIAALEQYGDCTEPICADGAVYIFCRMDEMAGGEFEPDETVWASMKQSLLEARQSQALDELVQSWRDAYEIEIDLSGLVFPE